LVGRRPPLTPTLSLNLSLTLTLTLTLTLILTLTLTLTLALALTRSAAACAAAAAAGTALLAAGRARRASTGGRYFYDLWAARTGGAAPVSASDEYDEACGVSCAYHAYAEPSATRS
jgi:2-methylcitrate dehydratase PrpD